MEQKITYLTHGEKFRLICKQKKNQFRTSANNVYLWIRNIDNINPVWMIDQLALEV